MRLTILLSAAAILLAGAAHPVPAPAPAEGVQPVPAITWQDFRDRAMQEQRQDAACCKRCSKGKPCGDSCISRNKSCHKGPGCAC